VFISGQSTIMAEYQGNDNDLVVLSDGVNRLGLQNQLSPAKDRYFCVEVVSTEALTVDWDYPPYRSMAEDFGGGEKPIPPLDHLEPAYGFRIHTLAGQLVRSIAIERLYSARYSRGKWLSDRMIVLQVTGRWSVLWTLLLDTQTGKKHVIPGVDEIKATRDGRVVWETQGALFADFVSIYPFYGEECLNVADRDSWEQFRQRHYIEKKPFFSKRPELAEHTVEGWVFTPDEQQILFLDKHPKGTRPPELVRIDLRKIATAKSLGDYSRAEPLPQDSKAALVRDDKAREISVRAPDNRILWRKSFKELEAEGK